MMKENKNYDLYDYADPNFIGCDRIICNGCGLQTTIRGYIDHLNHCEISKIRRSLDIKSNGKAEFTKVR